MLNDNELLKNMLDIIHDGVYVVDRDVKIVYWNKGAEKITGYGEDEVLGYHCKNNILNHTDSEGARLCGTERCPAVRVMTEGVSLREELTLKHKEGHRVPVVARFAPVRANGEIVGAVETFSDISAAVAAREKIEELERLALIDTLTGVGNREYADINLADRLDSLKRYGWDFGVLFIDIDGFKKINDLHGHDNGDKLLKMTAKTISNAVRGFDIVCRWGGDEFIAIILNVSGEKLIDIAKRVRSLVEQSVIARAGFLKATVSVGATMARKGDTAGSLLKRADQLMYRGKSEGGNRVSF